MDSRNRDLILWLYEALVQPTLKYALHFWAPVHRKNVLELENIQRRAIKLIRGMEDLRYEERLKELSLFSRNERTQIAEISHIQTSVIRVQIRTDSVSLKTRQNCVIVMSDSHVFCFTQEYTNTLFRIIHCFSDSVSHSWSVPMMEITDLSHLLKWDNLHNRCLSKYFFCPTVYVSESFQTLGALLSIPDFVSNKQWVPFYCCSKYVKQHWFLL